MMLLSPTRLRVFVGLLAFLIAAPASADVFRDAQYSLMAEEDPLTYLFTAQVPAAAASNVQPVWPDGCETLAQDKQRLGERMQYSFELACADPFSAEAVIQAPWNIDGATFTTNVMDQNVQQAMPGSVNGVSLPIGSLAAPERSLLESAQYYTWQGVIHIWMGWDHLAFVLCLCLVSRGKQLLWLVTAFTLGHSVSLALAFFQVVSIPIPPVEAIIALSIALMAREAIFHSKERATVAQSAASYGVMVTLFGLLHGLGFASALDGLGVAQSERVSGLIFFNIGVEVGQLIFVGAVTLALMGLREIALATPARLAAAWAAGVIGCFWTIERVVGFPWT